MLRARPLLFCFSCISSLPPLATLLGILSDSQLQSWLGLADTYTVKTKTCADQKLFIQFLLQTTLTHHMP